MTVDKEVLRFLLKKHSGNAGIEELISSDLEAFQTITDTRGRLATARSQIYREQKEKLAKNSEALASLQEECSHPEPFRAADNVARCGLCGVEGLPDPPGAKPILDAIEHVPVPEESVS